MSHMERTMSQKKLLHLPLSEMLLSNSSKKLPSRGRAGISPGWDSRKQISMPSSELVAHSKLSPKLAPNTSMYRYLDTERTLPRISTKMFDSMPSTARNAQSKSPLSSKASLSNNGALTSGTTNHNREATSKVTFRPSNESTSIPKSRFVPFRLFQPRSCAPNLAYLRKVIDRDLVLPTTLPQLEDMQKMLTEIEKSFSSNPQQSRTQLYDSLHELYFKSIKLGLFPLTLSVLYSYAMIAKAYHDINKAIYLFKQHKSLCSIYNADNEKMRCYHELALAFQELTNYDKAFSYVKKQLKLAWKLENQDYELRAYDTLGMIHYYKGNLEKAEYFENRMRKGLFEPKHSSFRKLALDAVKNSKFRRECKFDGNQDQLTTLYLSSGDEDNEDIPFDYSIRDYHDLEQKGEKISETQNATNANSRTDYQKKVLRLVQTQIRKSQQKTKYVMGESVRSVFIKKEERKPSKAKDFELIKDVGKWIIQTVNSQKGFELETKVKDPITINHLSTNRVVENYYIFDQGSPLNYKKTVLDFQLDMKIKAQILRQLSKIKTEILRHIEFIKTIHQKDPIPQNQSTQAVGVNLPFPLGGQNKKSSKSLIMKFHSRRDSIE